MNQDNVAGIQTARAAAARARRSGRKPAIDVSRTWEIADELEEIVGRRFDLVHSARMGWLLRRWDTWFDRDGKPRMGWTELDSAPEGQLGALLVRHQQRVRGLIGEQSP